MAVSRRWVWAVLAVLLTVAASTPLWVKLPVPSGTLVIDHAGYATRGGPPLPVTLPHTTRRHGSLNYYRVAFELAHAPAQQLYLFIPTLNERAIVTLDGDVAVDTGMHTLIPGITLGTSAMVPLSGSHLTRGRHVIDVLLESPGISRGYLSAMYVGTADQIAPYYRLRVLVFEHLRMMVLACQILLAVATLVAWLYRPREPLFGWLFLLHLASLSNYAGLLVDVAPNVREWLPYVFMINMASTFALIVIALTISGARAPRWLRACAAAAPAGCMLLMASRAVPPHFVLVGIAIPIMVLSPFVTVAIAAWGALARKIDEAWLLLVPVSFFALALLYDGALVAGWVDSPVFLSLYYRTLLIGGIAVILMRRLGISLVRLDEANVNLTRRLAERESELRRLHEEERSEAARRVRSEERHRLTVDLHDGLSGHLASIVALAERERAAGIERTAREALDDLRVVIHSLDIGDRELVAALSGLRERLERQLKRLGIALEWSMARLPEISGVTPTQALNVLRIVQEAVTNAVRHGPASRIAVRGDADAAGLAAIVIDNDGAPYAPGAGKGSGLDNMRRRAQLLGGALRVEALPGGTRVVLALPLHLPVTLAPMPAPGAVSAA